VLTESALTMRINSVKARRFVYSQPNLDDRRRRQRIPGSGSGWSDL